MAYLIDGNNFIGYDDPRGLADPRGRRRLLGKLLIFRRIERTKIILVFDGPPEPGLEPESIGNKSLLLLYPQRDQSADDVIKEVISRRKDLRRFFVVSSDRELQAYARLKGAHVLGCPEFNRKLRGALKKNRERRAMAKNVSPPSQLEVEFLSDILERKG